MSTATLTDIFTVKNRIIVVAFRELDAIDSEFAGDLVDVGLGTDTESMWNMIPTE